MPRLLLLIVALLALAPAQAHNQTVAADNPTHADTSQKSPHPPSVVPQVNVDDHGQNKSGQDKNERGHGGLLDYLGVFLTVVIAIAACIQAGAAVWQAHSSKQQLATMNDQVKAANEQAVASNKSAEAALRGVLSLEKLERPFLMVELRGPEGFKDEIWLINKGKVPAQILWYNPMGTFRLQSTEEMEEMPAAEEFNYGYLHDVETAKVINVPWIAPDGEMKLTNFDWISLAEDLKAAYQNGQKFAYLLSTVKYRGMLTDTVFESRWCCRWFGRNYGGLRLDGPPGFNDYT